MVEAAFGLGYKNKCTHIVKENTNSKCCRNNQCTFKWNHLQYTQTISKSEWY